MRFKKRYILLILFIGLIIVMKMEFMSMRTSDEKFQEELTAEGITDVTYHDIEVDGRNIHYLHRGKEGKPLVMLIHGTPGSATMYKSYLLDPKLNDVAQIISVDRAGLGYSGFGQTVRSVQQQCAFLKPILDKHASDQIIILGHSYGGPVVARMAMDFPDLIDGMVIVAGSVSPELEPREWWRGPVDFPGIRHIIPTSLRVSNQEIMALYNELMIMKPLWEKITCPTIVFQGTDDKLVPAGNANYADTMLVNCPDKEIIFVEGGDHFILWSKMDDIVGKVVEMIEKGQSPAKADTLSTPPTGE